MAKGRGRKSNEAKQKAPGAAPKVDRAALKKAEAKADRGLRKHLKQLQRQLADAARTEAKRVRKLEKARWRRQRLEAAVDEVKTASSVAPGKPSPKTKASAESIAPVAAEPKVVASKPKAAVAAKPKAAAASKPKSAAAPKPKAAAVATPKAAVAAAPKATTAAPPAVAVGGQVIEAYCLREKKRVQMADPKPVVTANGGSAVSGTCPSCGAALYKLVSRTAR